MAGLPLLGALWLDRKGIEEKLAETAKDCLSTVKADWAKVSVNGRDAQIEGDAPGRIAIDQAVRAVAGTLGVRRVDAVQVKVVLATPTVASLVTSSGRPGIEGNWPDANRLSAVGYGETIPIGDNGMDQERASNRRIEIKIAK
jgi:hypothetical protein